MVEPTITNLAKAMLDVALAKRRGTLLPGKPSDELRMTHLGKHTPETVTRKYLDVCLQEVGH